MKVTILLAAAAIDERGVKVHGVSYTRDQARTPGLTIAF